MRIDRVLNRMSPRRFAMRIVLVVFLGTHLPLLALLLYAQCCNGGAVGNAGALAVVALATLAGMGLCLVALRAILSPLYRIHDALIAVGRRRRPAPPDFGDGTATVAVLTDRLVQSLSRELQQSRLAADTDPLTGVLNRRGFDRLLRSDASGAMIYLDLDHFKSVNDRLGHDAGDAVLIEAAVLLSRTLRNGDYLARFGGEEFVIFLEGADAGTASRIAERLRATLEQFLRAGDQPVTASVGVALKHWTMEPDEAVREADAAAYRAKAAGRNRVELCPRAQAELTA